MHVRSLNNLIESCLGYPDYHMYNFALIYAYNKHFIVKQIIYNSLKLVSVYRQHHLYNIPLPF